jgi:hypothetical protein
MNTKKNHGFLEQEIEHFISYPQFISKLKKYLDVEDEIIEKHKIKIESFCKSGDLRNLEEFILWTHSSSKYFPHNFYLQVCGTAKGIKIKLQSGESETKNLKAYDDGWIIDSRFLLVESILFFRRKCIEVSVEESYRYNLIRNYNSLFSSCISLIDHYLYKLGQEANKYCPKQVNLRASFEERMFYLFINKDKVEEVDKIEDIKEKTEKIRKIIKDFFTQEGSSKRKKCYDNFFKIKNIRNNVIIHLNKNTQKFVLSDIKNNLNLIADGIGELLELFENNFYRESFKDKAKKMRTIYPIILKSLPKVKFKR